MPGITDMHCHILPGLDDGAQTIEETIMVLLEAERQQINRMIVTPHYHPGRYMANAAEILDTLKKVKIRAKEAGVKIELYPGQECYYYSGLAEQLEKGNVLTLAGSRYVLVEFEPDCPFALMNYGLQELQNRGYSPIVAHFERYGCLTGEEHLTILKQRGIRLQMNFDMLLEKDGIFHKNPWRRKMKLGIVDYLGSDCHGKDFRPMQVGEACSWINRFIDVEERERILRSNIRDILSKQRP